MLEEFFLLWTVLVSVSSWQNVTSVLLEEFFLVESWRALSLKRKSVVMRAQYGAGEENNGVRVEGGVSSR
jgi:hypothetical protein